MTDWEWVVVDDGSTDGTAELIRELADPRIKYFRLDKTQGPGVARNFAMSKASGAWLVIQDMDDFSFPTRLEEARSARKQGYDFMSSYLALIDGNYILKGLRGWQTEAYPYGFSHGTLCGQSDILRHVGYPSYRRGEDQTMVLHLANRYRGLHNPQPLYVYHENASVKAHKAMLGHYCMIWQLRDLVLKGVLKPSLGIFRIIVMSMAKMTILALLFLVWPEFYEKTLSKRNNLKKQSANLLPTHQHAFLDEVATRFPMVTGAS